MFRGFIHIIPFKVFKGLCADGSLLCEKILRGSWGERFPLPFPADPMGVSGKETVVLHRALVRL